MDQIREKVFNYVLVMARPLVMYENDHPIHWSPAYTDGQVNYETIESTIFSYHCAIIFVGFF